MELAKHKTEGIRTTYGNAPQGALVALLGSSGRLELAIVGGSAAKTLQAAVGDPVAVRWE